MLGTRPSQQISDIQISLFCLKLQLRGRLESITVISFHWLIDRMPVIGEITMLQT